MLTSTLCRDWISAPQTKTLPIHPPDFAPSAGAGLLCRWEDFRAPLVARVRRITGLPHPDAVRAVYLVEFGCRPDSHAVGRENREDRQTLTAFVAKLRYAPELLAELEALAGRSLSVVEVHCHRGGGRRCGNDH